MKNNKQNNNRVRAVIGLVAFSTLALGGIAIGEFGTQTAMAGDNKIISGHACAPLDSYGQTDRSNPEFIENILGGGVQTYMCPVVRDDPNGGLDFVRVRTEDNGSEPGVPECTVYSVSPTAGAMDMSTTQTSTGGVDTLEFPLNDFTEFDNGHYVIECSLGENDRIFSYRYKED